MSAPASFGNTGKKAVHVKWAGKTIALGTFPASEADEKCARAKALTRAWRSTMRPKPTREWVMLELERLGVRVVSGRLGRKAGEEGEEGDKKGQVSSMSGMGGAPSVERTGSIGWGTDGDLSNLMGGRRGSLSMMNDGRRGSLGSLGQMVGLDGGDLVQRSMGGGFDISDAQRRGSNFGHSGFGGGLGTMGMSVNPNQHYEMLKLHHMNLLNEIQETTLMMNLYQQQQLQAQQNQLQQQASAEGLGGVDHQMTMLQNQQNGMDTLFGANQLSQQQRTSLGLSGTFNAAQMQMMANQQHLQQQPQAMMSGAAPTVSTSETVPPPQPQADKGATTSDGNQAESNKRPVDEAPEEQNKRIKTEDDEADEDAKDADEGDDDDDDDNEEEGDEPNKEGV